MLDLEFLSSDRDPGFPPKSRIFGQNSGCRLHC
jgi:hypothetical protein